MEIAFSNKALDSISIKKKIEKLYPHVVLNEFAHLELKYNERLQKEIPHKYINLNKYIYHLKPHE